MHFVEKKYLLWIFSELSTLVIYVIGVRNKIGGKNNCLYGNNDCAFRRAEKKQFRQADIEGIAVEIFHKRQYPQEHIGNAARGCVLLRNRPLGERFASHLVIKAGLHFLRTCFFYVDTNLFLGRVEGCARITPLKSRLQWRRRH